MVLVENLKNTDTKNANWYLKMDLIQYQEFQPIFTDADTFAHLYPCYKRKFLQVKFKLASFIKFYLEVV